MVLHRFPKGFLWGVSTSAYQVEGGWDVDGKGLSIWDDFAHTSGRVLDHATGDVACDHYHRFRGDVGLMKGVGVNAYRFSVSWPRVFPKGFGRVNRFGLRFYQDLVDGLLGVGISPVVTLYHWDLPLELQKRGGWLNKQMPLYFEDYARFLFENLEGVKYWITINEPWTVAYSGYALGWQPPALKDMRKALQVAHNLLLAHGRAVNTFNELGVKGKIGIALSVIPIYPKTPKKQDLIAAKLQDQFHNKWFLNPILKGSYPKELLSIFNVKYKSPRIDKGDLTLISAPIHFLGVNYYFREVVQAVNPNINSQTNKTKNKTQNKTLNKPNILFEPIKTARFINIGSSIFPQEQYPKGLFDALIDITKTYGIIPLIITENGAAFKDIITQHHRIHDSQRIRFLYEHILQAWKALKQGVDLKGFFVWSLLDNFEWMSGYNRRFGIIYVDFKTLKRYPKDSACFYKQVIKDRGLVKPLKEYIKQCCS